MSSILGFIKFIIISAVTYFLIKKAGRSNTLKTIALFCGSFIIATIIVLIGWTIVEGFFVK